MAGDALKGGVNQIAQFGRVYRSIVESLDLRAMCDLAVLWADAGERVNRH